MPAQAGIQLKGHALQCRITTENPEQNFISDYGRITVYRVATGFGIRLDGGTANSGAAITRFYDPLLEKVSALPRTPEEAIARATGAVRILYSRRGKQPDVPQSDHHAPGLLDNS